MIGVLHFALSGNVVSVFLDKQTRVTEFFDTRHSPISITATEIPQYRVSRTRLVGQKKMGRKGGGLPNLSQIRKHCKVKTQASQVAAAPQSEYYTTSFNTKFTRLQR